MENLAFGRNKNSLILSLLTLLTLIPLLLGYLSQPPQPVDLKIAGLKVSVTVPASTAAVSVKPSGPRYRVMEIVDGDTIKIQIDNKISSVRLIGIDTPETKDPRKSVQCFGKEASAKLTELLKDKSVTIAFDPTQDQQDKYGRLLLYVWVDNLFVNEYLVRQGYAHEYTYDVPYQYQREFKADEIFARENNLGLWGQCPAAK